MSKTFLELGRSKVPQRDHISCKAAECGLVLGHALRIGSFQIGYYQLLANELG